MSTEFHEQVRTLIEAALQQPPEQRTAFITRAAGDDVSMLREVRSLLPHYLEVAGLSDAGVSRPQWRLPGTTTFSQAVTPRRYEQDWQPPFSIAPYTVVDVLGRGGMGVVYRGIEPLRGRYVAIKVLRQRLLGRDDRYRFKREEEVLRQLKHPGFVRVLHGGVARVMIGRGPGAIVDRRPYFVMEYVEGRPLVAYADEQKLTVIARLALLVQVCEAVEYAHARGVIHCDLKPDNILVTADGVPKVLDFGIARLFELAGPTVEADRSVAATFSYASPEQLRQRVSQLSPRTDVYSLGLIGAELLTGRLPGFEDGRIRLNLSDVVPYDRCAPDNTMARQFRYALEVILATALRKTSGEQYATAGPLGADLAQLREVFAPVSLWESVRRWLTRTHTPDDADNVRQRLLTVVLHRRIGHAMERNGWR